MARAGGGLAGRALTTAAQGEPAEADEVGGAVPSGGETARAWALRTRPKALQGASGPHLTASSLRAVTPYHWPSKQRAGLAGPGGSGWTGAASWAIRRPQSSERAAQAWPFSWHWLNHALAESGTG